MGAVAGASAPTAAWPASSNTENADDPGFDPGLRAEIHDVWTDDGVRLALSELRSSRRTGAEAPVFFMIPGFAQNRRAFLEGPLPDALLRRGGRVFVGELRGHGLSRQDRSPPRWTVDSHVTRDLPALTAHTRRLTEAARLHVIGHSMGGLLALAWLNVRRPVASLTTLASPLHIGAERALVRWAARLAHGLRWASPGRQVRVDVLLRALSGPLSVARPGPAVALLQTLTALANPRQASPRAVERVLARADPESPAVFAALVEMVRRNDARLDGCDLEAAGRRLSVPWVAIHGGRDLFAPPSSVEVLNVGLHAGPRTVIQVPAAAHVDLVIGDHIEAVVTQMWSLLFPG